MKSPALPLLLAALATTSTAFTAQSVQHARPARMSRSIMRLCASQQRHQDEQSDGPAHRDIAETLDRERYLRAVECSKTNGLCDVAELEELSCEFEQVFENDIPYSQELEQHVAQYVPNMYSDLKQRMKELNIKVNKVTSDYRQLHKDEWDTYLGGFYGTSGLAS